MSLVKIVAGSGVLAAVAIWYQRTRRIVRRYPPGPKPDPIIGNLRHMPKEHMWLTFAKWGEESSPLTYIDVLGQPILVINDHNVAVDLLEKRGQIYSDRHQSVMLVDLVGEWLLLPCMLLLTGNLFRCYCCGDDSRMHASLSEVP